MSMTSSLGIARRQAGRLTGAGADGGAVGDAVGEDTSGRDSTTVGSFVGPVKLLD